MRTLILSNEKGGCGKTTSSLHIGAGLSLLYDMKTLIIDADAQSHCAHQLNVPEFGGLFHLLVQGAEWNEVLREPDAKHWSGTEPTIGRLLLLPSSLEIRAVARKVSDPLLLRKRLQELEGFIDVVIIDTSPTPSRLHSMLYLASDAVIYPTKCEMLSLDSLAKTVFHIARLNEARLKYDLEPMKMLGVLPTMYTDTRAHNLGLDQLEQHFGIKNVWRPIAMRTIWRDREYAKQTLFAYDRHHEATEEITAVVRRVAQYVTPELERMSS
jgi:chromosome partitioning protein